MKLEANIFPKFELTHEDTAMIEQFLQTIPKMERYFQEAPLSESPTVTLSSAEFDEGMEHSWGVVENYQFIITRRFMLHGELHVGGANGEILNVYTFISGLKRFLEEQLALRTK